MSDRVESRASKELREALRGLVRARRAANAEPLETMSPAAFRTVVAERLRALERDLGEVRSRVNGLLFVVAGAVATQVVLRLFG
ncbi:MAG TPA: hypothetical protein VFH62_04545 [Dehalococcoidia bacterium]|jgi:hypothetical protein|nr:hypothetical protein [Dehalococcoidia bacterium]